MAVLKQTSPTACPVAPNPWPSSTVPSASTSTAVGAGSAQPLAACLSFMRRLHSRRAGTRQSGKRRNASEVDMLRDDINAALKDAMKSGDKRRVSTLRLVNSAVKNADIEARGQGKAALNDDDLLGLLQK